MVRQPAIVAGLTLVVVILVGLTTVNLAYGQFVGYPSVSPAIANQPR